MNFDPRAIQLIMELRTKGISDLKVLSAIERTPRDLFVMETFQDRAWDDTALPIEDGQTISQPFVVAYMTAALELGHRMRVLEIGTGSGYQAAILSGLCRMVYSVEQSAELRKQAEARFKDLGLSNVVTIRGDGRNGWPQQAPFDRIILTAAASEPPAFLKDQLREGGIACRIDLPGVGRNLQDHLLGAGNLYAAARQVPPSRYQHSESLLYARLADHDGAPELVVACVLLPAVTECFDAPAVGAAYTLMFGFTHPASRGVVRLVSDDPDLPPLIDPAYLSAPQDLTMFAAALDLARRIGGAKALAEWRQSELLPGPSVKTDQARCDFLRRAAHTHHHPVGTCRIGTGSGAVVGPDLKLRGTDGIHVVDGSVMPSLTTGPVNAAIVAIAERASDIIQGRAPLAPITSVRPD